VEGDKKYLARRICQFDMYVDVAADLFSTNWPGALIMHRGEICCPTAIKPGDGHSGVRTCNKQ